MEMYVEGINKLGGSFSLKVHVPTLESQFFLVKNAP